MVNMILGMYWKRRFYKNIQILENMLTLRQDIKNTIGEGEHLSEIEDCIWGFNQVLLVSERQCNKYNVSIA